MVAWVEGFWVEDREQERGKRDRESYRETDSHTERQIVIQSDREIENPQ